MNMVERVARQIHADLEATMPRHVRQSWDAITDLAKAAMLVRARAAIMALREPSREMLQAGMRELGTEDHRPLGPMWRAMIDAALGKSA